MRIFHVHEYYQQPGGEDRVFEAQAALQRQRGHDVHTYVEHNDRIAQMPAWQLAANTIWSRSSYRTLKEHFERVRPEVVHFHNTLPLISPSGYDAARSVGAAVVQTVQNYRLLCPAATLLRDGKVCEKCVGRAVALPAIRHRCYRGSLGATAVVTAMLAVHRQLGTWRDKVDRYVTVTSFARDRLIAGGLPADRIDLAPNFLTEAVEPGTHAGGYALFVGRLSVEKGIATLIAAWERGGLTIPLWIAGDGPLAAEVEAAAGRVPAIRWLGRRGDAIDLMRDAAMVVVPSIWYEGFPVVVVEAMAAGAPVVASRLGNLAVAVEPDRTGLLFEPGDWQGLAHHVRQLADAPDTRARMSRAARAVYEEQYTPDQHYDRLMAIYHDARATRARG